MVDAEEAEHQSWVGIVVASDQQVSVDEFVNVVARYQGWMPSLFPVQQERKCMLHRAVDKSRNDVRMWREEEEEEEEDTLDDTGPRYHRPKASVSVAYYIVVVGASGHAHSV